MLLKNATIFQYPPAYRDSFNDIDTLLREHYLKPMGPLEIQTSGFLPPMEEVEQAPDDKDGDGDGFMAQSSQTDHFAMPQSMHHRIGDTLWLVVAVETKDLPSHVINRQLAKRLKEFEVQNGKAPGSKMRRQIKSEIVEEMLPHAPVRSARINVMIDLERGLCVVDTASKKAAETAVSQIRAALGSFPALPISAAVDPRLVMTGWIAGDDLPEGMALGEDCEMKEPVEGGAIVRCKRQDLSAEEVAGIIESGKKVTRLASRIDDNLSFVFCEDLVIRNVKLLDGALEELESTEREDINAELDARFALMRGEFTRLWEVKKTAFKINEITQ